MDDLTYFAAHVREKDLMLPTTITACEEYLGLEQGKYTSKMWYDIVALERWKYAVTMLKWK